MCHQSVTRSADKYLSVPTSEIGQINATITTTMILLFEDKNADRFTTKLSSLDSCIGTVTSRIDEEQTYDSFTVDDEINGCNEILYIIETKRHHE